MDVGDAMAHVMVAHIFRPSSADRSASVQLQCHNEIQLKHKWKFMQITWWVIVGGLEADEGLFRPRWFSLTIAEPLLVLWRPAPCELCPPPKKPPRCCCGWPLWPPGTEKSWITSSGEMTFFLRWFELTFLLFLAEDDALDGTCFWSFAILLLLFIALLLLLYDAAVTELLLFKLALVAWILFVECKANGDWTELLL